ncbi:Signal recognition particle receptor FtsY [hydrothermal vent metagenome]|uniref:Signal recognition particle receptor FtsY n=1 Tax=hydrothermal vent metagenome TaxID=652676 RepID=A0A3B0W202_9ZZZZ
MFKSIRDSLSRTRNNVFGQIASVLGTGEITEETWEDLEALLVQADIGVPTTLAIVESLQAQVKKERLYRADQLTDALKQSLRDQLTDPPPFEIDDPRLLTIVIVVGVNGSGKTTTIGKLSRYYKEKGRKVMLAAADTFRAAAIDQLKIWGERAGVPVIAGQPNGDPGAVAYDSIRAARARGYNLLFIDTAGRLHTKFNLMRELEKVHGVCKKSVHAAPHEVLLVLDAPTGQNALIQAEKFKESVNVTGVILTKLDSTAKGGMVFAIYRELGLPVRFIGTGEAIEDLAPFDPDQFVDALFE